MGENVEELDALLAGIVAHPHETVRRLVLADWLREHDQAERAELVHFHHELVRTCVEPDEHPDRAEWQARVVRLIDSGVQVCLPRVHIPLPGDTPFEGVFIPPGKFRMGGWDTNPDEAPLHEVSISDGFFLGVHPVTNGIWAAVMGALRDPGRPAQQPVGEVSHPAAELFCARFHQLTGWVARLPTEAEWEYACRAGTTTRYHWGDEPQLNRFRCGTPPYRRSYLDSATEVGTYPPNPWGLHDCHGNVAEWCQDVYAASFYDHWPVTDPLCLVSDTNTEMRVCRGGAWSRAPERCTASYRGKYPPGSEYETLGFRVVVETTPPTRPT